MSSKEIGIEQARKALGDLVTAVQQGADIVLTRNGKPAARIVRYQEAPMITATINVIDGELTVDVPGADDVDLAVDDGRTVFTVATMEPWGENEEDLGRADEGLVGLGWRRIGDWQESASGGAATCAVERA